MATQVTSTTRTPTPEGYNAELSAMHQKRYDNEVAAGNNRGGSDGIRKSSSSKPPRYQLSSDVASIGRRAAAAGLSGGVGKAAQKAVEGAAQAGLARGAEGMARRARMRRARRLRANKKERMEAKARKAGKKKMSGIQFWMVVGAAILKDTLDLFLHITVILSFLIIFVGLGITFITLFYFFYNRISFDSRKLASFAITGLVEILPIISMLPMATVNLFVIRYFEHAKGKKKKQAIRRAAAFAKRFA